MASTTEPAFQTAPEGVRGSFDPMSPMRAYDVLVNSPWPGVAWGPPDARPQGSYTGAAPGARQGFHLDQSASEPGTASRLMVRRC